MAMVEINRHPSERLLRQFSAAWLVFGGLAGAAALWKTASAPAALAIWAAAGAVGLAGMARPRLVRLVYVGTAYATFPIGWLISHALLAGVYCLLLTPMALLMRGTGADPLNRRFDRGAKTYWTPRSTEIAAERYFRQY